MRTGGEKLFQNFAGNTMEYVDRETGELVPCLVFVATLPASDYGYILFVHSQCTEDLVYAVTQCLKYLGDVPKMLVPDNLKSAVVKTDRYEPSLKPSDGGNGKPLRYHCRPCPSRTPQVQDKRGWNLNVCVCRTPQRDLLFPRRTQLDSFPQVEGA